MYFLNYYDNFVLTSIIRCINYTYDSLGLLPILQKIILEKCRKRRYVNVNYILVLVLYCKVDTTLS